MIKILHRNLILLIGLCVVLASQGCASRTKARTKARVKADVEANHIVAERNGDPRWHSDTNIDIDPRSRYFDPYDPDRPPLPPDDPTSHRYMHCVNGKRGWKHWHRNGDRVELENPSWRDGLGHYVEFDEEGAVKLDIDSAVRVAYVHSPQHQTQLETVYLTALDVSAERFFLDTQFFGGYDGNYVHNGRLNPSQIVYDGGLGRYIVAPPILGVESNRLTLGRPSTGAPTVQAQKTFATAGQLVVGLANSVMLEFTGSDASLSSSILNYSFVQPLLRGAGRDIGLENLTQVERNMLASLRAYSQFRQGFFTQIAIGELGVNGPTRFGSGTTLQSFGGVGGVGGYIGLLQQVQQIRNSRANLNLQSRTLERLAALEDAGFIDLVQVDQFRQSVATEKANLLRAENLLELSLDRYKTTTLGLPPDLTVALDDSLIEQFQLVPTEAIAVQDATVAFQAELAELPDIPTMDQLNLAMGQAVSLLEPLQIVFANVASDLARLDEVTPARLKAMDEEDRPGFLADLSTLTAMLDELKVELDSQAKQLQGLKTGLKEANREETMESLLSWAATMLRLSERVVLIPTRARLESITIDAIRMEPSEAFTIALQNRLDFMNGRAALVDRWRQIQINADALQAVLNVTSSGELRTARNNPLDFRSETGTFRLGLQFDAPLTRLLERNAYRESLIVYQQNRRNFIQSRDALHLSLRSLLRQVEQFREALEIQRGAVKIALGRVDQTQLSLNPPRAATQPGQRPPINPTTAINLLSAQQSLRDTQNNFLNVWLNYYATRLRLYRELGIMVIDPDGQWAEHPLPGADEAEALEGLEDVEDLEELDAPGEDGRGGEGRAPNQLPEIEEMTSVPVIPVEWLEMAEDSKHTRHPVQDSIRIRAARRPRLHEFHRDVDLR